MVLLELVKDTFPNMIPSFLNLNSFQITNFQPKYKHKFYCDNSLFLTLTHFIVVINQAGEIEAEKELLLMEMISSQLLEFRDKNSDPESLARNESTQPAGKNSTPPTRTNSAFLLERDRLLYPS